MERSFFISEATDSIEQFFPPEAPRRNQFVGIIFVLTVKGEAVVEIDNRPCSLLPGTFLSVLPGHLLTIREDIADFSYRILAFTFDFMADYPYMLRSCISEQMEKNPCMRLSEEEMLSLMDTYSMICRHYPRTLHASYREILRSLAFIFTAEVSNLYASQPVRTTTSRTEEITDGFFHCLHEHFSTSRETAFYAGKLCITPKYLTKVIKQVTGQMPSYWIADFTVREAKALLRTTTLTASQVSDRLNFADSSFFARYFKRHAGLSPKAYRKS